MIKHYAAGKEGEGIQTTYSEESGIIIHHSGPLDPKDAMDSRFPNGEVPKKGFFISGISGSELSGLLGMFEGVF